MLPYLANTAKYRSSKRKFHRSNHICYHIWQILPNIGHQKERFHRSNHICCHIWQILPNMAMLAIQMARYGGDALDSKQNTITGTVLNNGAGILSMVVVVNKSLCYSIYDSF